jgi:hypothetical protein
VVAGCGFALLNDLTPLLFPYEHLTYGKSIGEKIVMNKINIATDNVFGWGGL